jgi:hypothetical protein
MLFGTFSIGLGVLGIATIISAAPRSSIGETTILKDSIRAIPVNAGINPRASALSISGKVLIGGNRCKANGVRARLEITTQGSIKYLTPVLVYPAHYHRRNCTMEMKPVYSEVTSTVRTMRDHITDIVIKNVDIMGNEVSAYDFIEAK